METARFVYVAYISTSPKELWKALIDPKKTTKYWQHENISDWKPGSKWEHRRSGKEWALDLVGKVIEFTRPHRLVITWAFPKDEMRENQHSKVSFEIKPFKKVTRLTVIHENLKPDSEMHRGIADGWPKVISSLKSFLEVGRPLPKLW